MNIRHRISLLVVLGFLATTLIGGFAAIQGFRSTKQVQSVTQGVVPSTLASAELVGQLKDVQLAVVAIVAAGDKNLAQQAKERLLENQRRLQVALDEQLKKADSEAQVGLVKEAKESLGNYFSAIEDTVNFRIAGQKDVAEANLSANVAGYLTEMEGMISALQLQKRRSKDDAIEALNGNMETTTLTVLVVTVLAVAGLSFVGLHLYRQIIHPITDMKDSMTAVATSHDYSHRLPVLRMDEIGQSVAAFNEMIGQIQESTELVKQKTADIQAMLHYIPQGILTIQAGNLIHPEYSEYLESILATQHIAGRDVMEVLFAQSDCNADIRSQIEAATAASIDEDSMNFEFNSHLLPMDITFTLPNGVVKYLDLNWSPITDDQDVTRRILLCVRDVTELRALAKEAEGQKRELGIIGEILAVPRNKFDDFISGSMAFVAENKTLITDADFNLNGKARADLVNVLFRNMHTIKGNARTFGLLLMTNVIHEVEQSYDELRQNPDLAWNGDALLADLERVQASLNEYAQISEVKLGRGPAGSAGAVSSSGGVDASALAKTLARLKGADPKDKKSLAAAVEAAIAELELAGTVTVADVISPVVGSLPSLAKELGKEAPVVQIHDHGVRLHREAADVLKNVGAHLFRNSMDHGIESPAVRTAAGKSAAGHIHFNVALKEGALKMRLHDDGKGLDLATIWAKAIQKAIVPSDAELTSSEIAQLIFVPGFSTASAVTEVSGRGVGMDAVKRFVEDAGGSIELVLLDDIKDRDQVPFETVITLPASFALQGDVLMAQASLLPA
jgi:two-component system chemotaxis sensor kinase CheA